MYMFIFLYIHIHTGAGFGKCQICMKLVGFLEYPIDSALNQVT